MRLLVPRSIEVALEFDGQWALQAQDNDDEVDRRRKAVEREEEESYRADNAEDRLKAVRKDREGEKA